MEENLLGYLLNALDPRERRDVESYLLSHPEARQRLEMIRQAIQPLAADQDAVEPPPGLRTRAIARVADYRCRPLPRAPQVRSARDVQRTWWRRADVLVAASLLLVFSPLVVPGIAYLHHRRDIASCQNNLRSFYMALMTYSDQFDGDLPKVEKEPPRNFAGVFVPILHDGGYLRDVSVSCPANGSNPPQCVTLATLKTLHDSQPEKFREYTSELGGCYAYPLGYWGQGGQLCGLRRAPDQPHILLPIMADRPPFDSTGGDPSFYVGNSINHGGKGQNVLYLDGSCRFCTDRHVGADANDIYLNADQRLEAGVNALDSVLAASSVHPCPPEE
ncbi:MAG TPA: hypothetical protein VK395_03930 [Gemmataceae bacterium]|nr:hypothetical protein [Gemmataceae bacterium]